MCRTAVRMQRSSVARPKAAPSEDARSVRCTRIDIPKVGVTAAVTGASRRRMRYRWGNAWHVVLRQYQMDAGLRQARMA